MKKLAQKRKNFGTLAEFAAATKTPLKTLGGWVRRPDWPFERKAPWPLQRAHESLRWAANNLERGRHGKDLDDASDRAKLNDEKLRQEVRKLTINANQADAEYNKTLGNLLDAGEVEAAWAAVGVTIRNAIENLPSQIVPLALTQGMASDSAAAFQAQLEELIAGVLRHLSRDPIQRAAAKQETSGDSLQERDMVDRGASEKSRAT